MANWLILASTRWLSIIFGRMQQDILHSDETVLQVLHEPGRLATSDNLRILHYKELFVKICK